MQVQSGYLKILASALIWGTIGAFVRWSAMPPLELSFLRLVIAGFTLSLFLPRERFQVPFTLKNFLLVGLAGVLFAVDCVFFFTLCS